MGTNLQSNLRYVVGELEDTPGTAETPADADFDVRGRNVEVSLDIPFDNENAKFGTGDHTEDEAISGVHIGRIKFQVKLAWGGAVNTAPNWVKFIKACGAIETAYGATGIGYTPEKAGDEVSITLWVMDIQRGATPAAVAYKFAGCMGNCVIGADGVGSPWVADFDFQGKLTDIADVANGSILSLTSPDTTVAERLLSNPFTVGGTAQAISSFQLDFGNEVVPQYDQSETTGVDYFAIATRRPRFSYNPLALPVATDDVMATVTGETLQAISLATAAASPHFTISAPKAQMMNPGVANREGLVNWEHNMRLLRNTAGANDAEKERTWQFLQGATS